MTATAELDAILAAVLREPDEDVHRLAFADRLDERGEDGDAERAEFIRLQVQLGRGCNVCDGTGRNVVSACLCAVRRNRERKLWWADGTDWMPAIPGITQSDVRDGHHAHGAVSGSLYGSGHEDHPGRIDCDFRRGFLDRVTCSAADWLRHGDAILAAHPVTDVTLTTLPPYEWQFDNLPAGWPLHRQGTGGRRLFAADALEHRWPRVTFHLPALPRDQYAHWRTAAG